MLLGNYSICSLNIITLLLPTARDQQTTGNMERELNCYALVNIASFMGLFTMCFTGEHVNHYKNLVGKSGDKKHGVHKALVFPVNCQ